MKEFDPVEEVIEAVRAARLLWLWTMKIEKMKEM